MGNVAVLGLATYDPPAPPHAYIVHEGDNPIFSCILLSGFAVRQKIAGNGGRQILSLQMTGDLVDLHNVLLDVADHSVQTISPVIAAYIPVEAITTLTADHPAIGRAMWHETLRRGVSRAWIYNIGRRNALTRTAHFLCEVSLGLDAAGLATGSRFELPLTQEQLGDVLGLTSVHVNRTLKLLDTMGVVDREQRSIFIRDFGRLAKIGDFDPAYLHLGGSYPARDGRRPCRSQIRTSDNHRRST